MSWLWIRWFLGLSIFCCATVFSAEIHKWQDEHGNWNFSDTPRNGGVSEKVILKPLETYEPQIIEVTEESASKSSKAVASKNKGARKSSSTLR